MKIDGTLISLKDFVEACKNPVALNVSPGIVSRLESDRAAVEKFAEGDEPVYGLNTGLGANLSYRLTPEQIAGFQQQIIDGRSVAIGTWLPVETSRGILFYRILSAAKGYSGISPELFNHLCRIYEFGLAPAIPSTGSIGTGDLVQNAHFASAVLGTGKIWRDGKVINASTALKSCKAPPPDLGPKEAMVLTNHSGLTASVCGLALVRAFDWLERQKAVTLMSFEGYAANPSIFEGAVNMLRPAPGQAEIAAWFNRQLAGIFTKPNRIQDALSFRTIAPVYGAALHALQQAEEAWNAEANGTSDSPVITENGRMLSTPNFHTPALALNLEAACLANAMVANSSFQRMQKLMNPELSGLPKYLSPVGGGSAGFVPLQKTAASLLADIRHQAQPIAFDPPAVSDAVEDMAPMTPLVAAKLERQLDALEVLSALEALCAAQAIDLRSSGPASPLVKKLHTKIRTKVAILKEDRPLSGDIDEIVKTLRGLQV